MADNMYWVTFRLVQDATRQDRYDMLVGALNDAATGGSYWDEPTSFWLFNSSLSIDEISAMIGDSIDTGKDVALIGMPHKKSARVVGKVDDKDLFKIHDFVKQV